MLSNVGFQPRRDFVLHDFDHAFVDALALSDHARAAFNVEPLCDAADESQIGVKLRVGVTPSATVGSFPIKIREAAQVDQNSSVLRSLQHPDECDVRQIGLAVAAADVGMAAAEPDFLICVFEPAGLSQ